MYPKKGLSKCCNTVIMVIIMILAIVGTIIIPVSLLAQGSVPTEVEQALLPEKWSKIQEKCGPAEKLASVPELRIIKGHACLLLNRNDESLRLFLSASKETDRAAWKEWTGKFAGKNPNSAVAQYLKGDALMRQEELDGAMAAFSQALALKKDFYPALNALGVASCAKRQWDKGQEYFQAAVKLAPNFADAYANLGTSWLYANGLAEAKSSFDKALKISPAFALANNGQGCVLFLSGPGKWQEAARDFAMAGKQMQMSLVAINADLMNQAVVDTVSKANLYLQPEEILNWEGLLLAIKDPKGFLHTYFSKAPVNERNKREVLDRLNALMDNPQFYNEQHKPIDDCLKTAKNTAPSGLQKLILDTKEIRGKKATELSIYEKSTIRGLNRALLNLSFPALLGETGKTKAGMSLTMNGGIAVDGYGYKQSRSTQELLAAKNRMTDIYRPMATALEQAPIIGFVGKMWNQHLDNSLGQTNDILSGRGAGKNVTLSGGLSTQELMMLFFKRDAWKPVNWFGLAYNVMPEGV